MLVYVFCVYFEMAFEGIIIITLGAGDENNEEEQGIE